MARNKKATSHVHQEEVEREPLSDNIVELQEQADSLWDKYFDKSTPYTDERREEIKTEYNLVANKINSIKGKGSIRLISNRTEWAPGDEEEVTPELEEVLDRNIADVVEANKAQEAKLFIETEKPKRKKKDTVQVMDGGGSGSKLVPANSEAGKAEIKRREQFKEDNPDSVAATAAPVKSQKKDGGKSIIEQILDLHRAGKTNKEIVALGFNKSTVNRQVGEYKKRMEGENGK